MKHCSYKRIDISFQNVVLNPESLHHISKKKNIKFCQLKEINWIIN